MAEGLEPEHGKLKEGLSAGALLAAELLGPTGTTEAQAAPPPVTAAATPHTTVDTFKVPEQWPREFSQGPEAGQLINPVSPTDIATAVEQQITVHPGEQVVGVELQGHASDDDNQPGAGLGEHDLKNTALAKKRAADLEPKLEAAFRQEGLTIPASEIQMARPIEDVLPMNEISHMHQLARHYGYHNVVEMIQAYNDQEHAKEGYQVNNAPKVPEEIVHYLDTEFKANRRVDVVVVLKDGRQVLHVKPHGEVGKDNDHGPHIPIIPIIPVRRPEIKTEPRPETPPTQEPPEPPVTETPTIEEPPVTPTVTPPPVTPPSPEPAPVPKPKARKDAPYKTGPKLTDVTKPSVRARSSKQPLPENFTPSKGTGRYGKKGADGKNMTRRGH